MMLHSERTDQAYQLLRSYAHTTDKKAVVDQTYIDILADNNNEDKAVIALLGLTLDGLRYGNWLWNMPPSAPLTPSDKAARLGR